MPHLYRAHVRLRNGTRVVAEAERDFGIRPLGAAGGNFDLTARAGCLRGVITDEVAVERTGLLARIEHDAASCADPDDSLCEAASRVGVLLVAELDSARRGEIRRLRRWPAVGIVVAAGADGRIAAAGQLGHNLLLAERFAAGEAGASAPWADAVIVRSRATQADVAARVAGCACRSWFTTARHARQRRRRPRGVRSLASATWPPLGNSPGILCKHEHSTRHRSLP